MDKSGIANVEDVERVYRETFILTTLKHVNIIKLFEVLDTPKSIMLVMEYAGGGELFSYVASKHRLGELESCRLFQQIISGVECKREHHERATGQPVTVHPRMLTSVFLFVLLLADCHRAKIIHRVSSHTRRSPCRCWSCCWVRAAHLAVPVSLVALCPNRISNSRTFS